MRRIMRRLRAIELSEDEQQPAAAESAPGAAAADSATDGAAAPATTTAMSTIPPPSGLLVNRERATGRDNEIMDTRLEPLETSLQDELDEGAVEVRRQLREQRPDRCAAAAQVSNFAVVRRGSLPASATPQNPTVFTCLLASYPVCWHVR